LVREKKDYGAQIKMVAEFTKTYKNPKTGEILEISNFTGSWIVRYYKSKADYNILGGQDWYKVFKGKKEASKFVSNYFKKGLGEKKIFLIKFKEKYFYSESNARVWIKENKGSVTMNKKEIDTLINRRRKLGEFDLADSRRH